MACRFLIAGFFLVLQGLQADAAEETTSAEGLRFYEAKIRPLLVAECYPCHSATAKKIRGELRLDTHVGWLKGGASGPAVVAGKPDDSPLLQAVRRTHKDIAAMPPDKSLTSEQIADLVRWVNLGAPAPTKGTTDAKPSENVAEARKHWPYSPIPAKVVIPAVQDRSWPRTPIDSFILAKLEAENLRTVGDADKHMLLRRVTFDLTGLPPSPEEAEAFLKDSSPQAYERLVDRLLASEAYGERWGRHWLDVVRYADTAGDNSDFPIPQMYLYRNWVIQAFRDDMPFDAFTKKQIAGDLLPAISKEERKNNIIATGYLALARRFGSRVDDYPWHLTIEDTIENLGRTFLGLSLNCARCHDHKFDPISMADYYGLYGFFQSTRYPWPGIELEQRQRDLVPLAAPDQVAKILAEREKRNREFEAEIKRLTQAKKTTSDRVQLETLQKQLDAVKKEQRKVMNAPLPFATAYAVSEGKKIEDAPIQFKGDPTKLGPVIPRKFLAVLGDMRLPPEDRSSGRLVLANWIASNENPLFARVFVNRVWQHHFGRGLVPTPNDFGKQGTLPTHPDLLDYLARSFIDSGFRIKALHRQMVLSRVYQLTSIGESPGKPDVDPNNDLLWKFRQRRLDAESIRDALLAVSGQLDRSMGEGHPFPDPTSWNFTQHKPFRAVYETKRRSVYLMTQRIQRHPFLAIFDGADSSASTGKRITSTTALQALFFLNDPFVHEQAHALAQRIWKEANDEPGRIHRAYWLLFARPPSVHELVRAREYLEQSSKWTDAPAAWESYVRALLRTNEFIYVD